MNIMLKKAVAILALVFVSTAAWAESNRIDLPVIGQFKQYQWKQVNGKMSHDEYNAAARHNKRMLEDIAMGYVEDTVTSLGISPKSLEIAGSAVAFAVKQGGKFKLTDNVKLELKDVIDNDRAMYLKMKFNW